MTFSKLYHHQCDCASREGILHFAISKNKVWFPQFPTLMQKTLSCLKNWFKWKSHIFGAIWWHNFYILGCHTVWKLLEISYWFFQFWHFPLIFVLLEVTYLVTLFNLKLQVFNNSSKWTILRRFWLFFVHSKCKRISLRSQYWIRLFLWFSNTVLFINLSKYTVLDF